MEIYDKAYNESFNLKLELYQYDGALHGQKLHVKESLCCFPSLVLVVCTTAWTHYVEALAQLWKHWEIKH